MDNLHVTDKHLKQLQLCQVHITELSVIDKGEGNLHKFIEYIIELE